MAPPAINANDQMWLGPDWTLVPYANPHYATKFKSMKNIPRRRGRTNTASNSPSTETSLTSSTRSRHRLMLLRLTSSSSRRSSRPEKNTFTKGHGMFILFRQTLVTALAFAFAVTAGQVRAENSFSTVVIDPGHGGSDPGGISGQIVPGKNGRTRYGIASARAFATSGLAHGDDALHGYFCSTVCAKRDRRRRTRRNLRQHPL